MTTIYSKLKYHQILVSNLLNRTLQKRIPMNHLIFWENSNSIGYFVKNHKTRYLELGKIYFSNQDFIKFHAVIILLGRAPEVSEASNMYLISVISRLKMEIFKSI